MPKLTAKQDMFCKEYLIDLNATQAAIRAGYSKKTAYAMGHENLRKPKLAKEIQILNDERSKRTLVNGDWVLEKLQIVAERCMTAEPVMIRGEDGMEESGEYKFDSSGANKSLELIGKHHKLFTDRLEIDGKLIVRTIRKRFDGSE